MRAGTIDSRLRPHRDTASTMTQRIRCWLADWSTPPCRTNAEERYLGMEITDRNGDGSSDILLRFSQGKGTLQLLFCWDPETENFLSVPS